MKAANNQRPGSRSGGKRILEHFGKEITYQSRLGRKQNQD